MNFLEEIRTQILKFFEGENANIYLYGSYARGTQKQSSDVDVAVEFVTNYNRKKISDAREFFEENNLPLTVNIADLFRADENFVAEVRRTGIVWKNARQNSAKKALEKLSLLADKKNLTDIERDSLILRFQFSFELLWKCGKDFLHSDHGFEVASPKKIIRAFREIGYFSDEETALLLQAADDRNLSAHIYDELKAQEISKRIAIYFPLLQKWLSLMDNG